MKKYWLFLVITAIASYLIAFMKLKSIWLGKFLLDYLFLPISIFLIFDGIKSINKDNKYLATRLIRIVIGTIVLTLHINFLLR